MAWLPTASGEVVVIVAVLPLLSVAVPIREPPSENVTVPVGVPVPEAGLTVAVNVTGCPGTDGFADDERAVVVVAAGLHTPMATLEPLPTDAPPRGFWVTTLPLSVLSQLLVVAGIAVSPTPFSVRVAWSWVCPMTLGTRTILAAGLHTPMATLEPLPTDAPPRGFWVTTLPLAVLLQLLVVVGTAVSPVFFSLLVAWSWVCPMTSGTATWPPALVPVPLLVPGPVLVPVPLLVPGPVLVLVPGPVLMPVLFGGGVGESGPPAMAPAIATAPT